MEQELICRLEEILKTEYPQKCKAYSPIKFDDFTALPFLNEAPFREAVKWGIEVSSQDSQLDEILQWFEENGEEEYNRMFKEVLGKISVKFPKIKYKTNGARILNQEEMEYLKLSREFVKRTKKIIEEYQKHFPEDQTTNDLLEVFKKLSNTLTSTAIKANFNQEFGKNCSTSIDDVCLFDGGSYPQMSRIYSLDPTIHLLDFSPEKSGEGQPQAMAILIEAKDEKGKDYLVVDGVPCNEKFDILKPADPWRRYKSDYEYIFASIIKYTYEHFLRNEDKKKRKNISLFINTRQWSNPTGKGSHEFLGFLGKHLKFKYEYEKQVSPKGDKEWNVSTKVHNKVSLKKDNKPLEEILKKHGFAPEEISRVTRIVTRTWGNIREKDDGWNHCDGGPCNGIVLSPREIKKWYLHYYGSTVDKGLYYLPRFLGTALAAIIGGGVASYNWPVVCENATVDYLTIRCDVDGNHHSFGIENLEKIRETKQGVRVGIQGKKYKIIFPDDREKREFSKAQEEVEATKNLLEQQEGVRETDGKFTPDTNTHPRGQIPAFLQYLVRNVLYVDLHTVVRTKELLMRYDSNQEALGYLMGILGEQAYQTKNKHKLLAIESRFNSDILARILERDPEATKTYLKTLNIFFSKEDSEITDLLVKLLDHYAGNKEFAKYVAGRFFINAASFQDLGSKVFSSFEALEDISNRNIAEILQFMYRLRRSPYAHRISSNLSNLNHLDWSNDSLHNVDGKMEPGRIKALYLSAGVDTQNFSVMRHLLETLKMYEQRDYLVELTEEMYERFSTYKATKRFVLNPESAMNIADVPITVGAFSRFLRLDCVKEGLDQRWDYNLRLIKEEENYTVASYMAELIGGEQVTTSKVDLSFVEKSKAFNKAKKEILKRFLIWLPNFIPPPSRFKSYTDNLIKLADHAWRQPGINWNDERQLENYLYGAGLCDI